MAEIADEFPDEKQRAAVCYSQLKTIQGSTYSYIQQNAQAADYNIDVKMHMGRKHIVVPVVMMVEGVHSGSAGAILHEAGELAKYPAAWNGIPVVVGHPEDNGTPISANIPDVLESKIVGRVYNTRFEGDGKNRLVAEAWLDEERLAEISPAALQYIRQRKPIDVSVGIFSDDEPIQGRWKDEEFTGIARNYRPDHLALLPDRSGACGWEDGCGVRINEEGDTMKTNEERWRVRVDAIKSKLSLLDTEFEKYYLEEIFDTYIIYRQESVSGGRKYFKQAYSFDDSSGVELQQSAEEMLKKVEYVLVNPNKEGGVNTMNKEDAKTEQKQNEDKGGNTAMNEEKVNKLLSFSVFTEQDKDLLAKATPCQLDRLIAMSEKASKKEEVSAKEATPQMNKEQAIEVLKSYMAEPKQFLQLVPKEYKEQMEYGMQLYKENKAKLETYIKENTDVYTDEEIKAMSFPELQKLAKVIKPKADYSGLAGGVDVKTNAYEVEPLLPPEIQVNINKEVKK